jgi:hypothetical protein
MSTDSLPSRAYPYVRGIWEDPSGSYRWTVSTSTAAILSALLALLLAFALGRLVIIVYTLCHAFFLHQSTTTLFDDQAHTIATNAFNPSMLLGSLFQLGFYNGRRALASKVGRILFIIALLLIGIQAALIVTIGRLFSNQPMPISPGTCGIPAAGNFSVQADFATYKSHSFIQYEKASSQYSQCVDDGKNVTCPGPAGQTFSWSVMESEPNYCWFGPKFCYNGSRTISQIATITPRDMGTLRNSRMSLTALAECSHVNASSFIRRGFNPLINTSFNAYEFGICK